MPGEVITDEIAIKRYEWWELTMMLKACRHCTPDVFIDVGANIGLYTCVLGRAGAARNCWPLNRTARILRDCRKTLLAMACLASLLPVPSQ